MLRLTVGEYENLRSQIATHSQVPVVNLALLRGNSGIELTIRDKGQGFDPDTVRRGLGFSFTSLLSIFFKLDK
jgi:glucose-6-phosphate-specific signal transduction histidine kinase